MKFSKKYSFFLKIPRFIWKIRYSYAEQNFLFLFYIEMHYKKKFDFNEHYLVIWDLRILFAIFFIIDFYRYYICILSEIQYHLFLLLKKLRVKVMKFKQFKSWYPEISLLFVFRVSFVLNSEVSLLIWKFSISVSCSSLLILFISLLSILDVSFANQIIIFWIIIFIQV